MKNFVYDTSLSAANMLRKTFTGKWLDRDKFNIETPESALNSLFDTTYSEIEKRISMPFGMKLLKERWLQSSADHSAASAAETCAASSLISILDFNLAVEIVRPFFHNQSDEGNIPLFVYPMSTSRFPAVFFVAEAVFQLSRATTISDLRAMSERLQKFSSWMALHKREEDGLYSHADARWISIDPFLEPLRAAIGGRKIPTYDFRSIALNSLALQEITLFEGISRKLGDIAEAEKRAEQASRLREIIATACWDEEAGCFFDLIRGERRLVITPASFLPLLAEIPTMAQANRMMAYLPDIFKQIDFIEQAPGLAHIFELATQGLLKYKKTKEAGELALAVARKAASLDSSPKYFPARLAGTSALIRHVLGFHKFSDRHVVYPKLPSEWAGHNIKIHDADKNRTIFMNMTGAMIDCNVIAPAGETLSAEIENHTFRNIPF